MAKKAKKPAKAETRPKPRVAPKKAAAAPRGGAAERASINIPPATTAPPKLVAVRLAVGGQLEADRHWHLAHDVTKVMGSDYRYDAQTMREFLYAVHRVLAAGTPPYTFQYDGEFVVAALDLNGAALIEAINENTTE